MTLVLSLMMLATTVEAREIAAKLATRLEAPYIDQAAAGRIASDLRKRAAAGDFDHFRGDELAKVLNEGILAVTGDPHLGIRFTAQPFVKSEVVAPSPEDREKMRRSAPSSPRVSDGGNVLRHRR